MTERFSHLPAALVVFAVLMLLHYPGWSQSQPSAPQSGDQGEQTPPNPNAGGNHKTVQQTTPAPASTVKVSDNVRFPETVNAGSTVSIPGNFPGDGTATVKIHTVGSDLSKDHGTDPDTTKKMSDTEIQVKLPDKLEPGRYLLTLSYADLKDEIIPSEVRVSRNAITLDSAHPTTAYRSDAGGFNFDVIGQGFSKTREDNKIVIRGQGQIIQSWADNQKDCDAKPKEKKPCLWYDPEDPDKLHVVGYLGEAYQGPLSFKVQVGDVQSAVEKPLVLARLSPAGIRFWSIIIFSVLAYTIYWLVAKGLRNNAVDTVIGGQSYSPLESFVLDKETDTYSLSKFQLLLFAGTFVFGYVYVFLCGWLVQWHFILPDVPVSFSGILGMSAGTTVIAAGATSARGSKGAGGVRPSVADFITTGGQVVPERFQYFVWTLIACFGFIALLLSQDPATLSGFPDIPQGLLYVMGVSAGGYLAGKVVRPAGPVIRNIAWNNDQKLLVVQGDNLSNEADYFVDSKKLPIVVTDPNNPAGDTKKLLTSTPEEQASDRTFCSELRITISAEAGLDLSTGDHVFRIMNKDAQFADARFTADPPQITSVTMMNPPPPPGLTPPAGMDPNKVLAAGDQNTDIQVKGSGFRGGIIARWTKVGAQQPIEITSVQVQDNQTLKLTLVPGNAGPAILLVLAPNGFSAVATVAVVAPSGAGAPGGAAVGTAGAGAAGGGTIEGSPAVPLPDGDDIDGCDVPVEKATSDEDLPAAEGGLA
jgi:hypothetical protein